jgi:hypothetical protein
VSDCGGVSCSLLLLFGSHCGYGQAETPLIPLFKFSEPALNVYGARSWNLFGFRQRTRLSAPLGIVVRNAPDRQEVEGLG